MSVACVVLFLSITGCITYGFVHWGKESTSPHFSEQNDENDKAAV